MRTSTEPIHCVYAIISIVQATFPKRPLRDASAPEKAREEDLVEDLNALNCFIHKASGPQFFAVAEELELSVTQIKILNHLESAPREVSLKELGETLGLSLPAVSRTVDTLLVRGLLLRRMDEKDRRVRRVALTPIGHDTVMRLHRARVADLERFVATLSDDDRRRISAALRPLLMRADIRACRTSLTSPETRRKDPSRC